MRRHSRAGGEPSTRSAAHVVRPKYPKATSHFGIVRDEVSRLWPLGMNRSRPEILATAIIGCVYFAFGLYRLRHVIFTG